MTSLLEYLPRGNMLDEQEWQKRHSFLQWILFVHLPGLLLFGLALHHSARISALTLVPPLVCLLLGRLVPHRRLGSLFIVIGFIALYQDWLPFLWNIVFTVMSHGLGSAVRRDLIFDHQAGQASPWVWSGIHGLAVLAACIGVVVFWRTTEQEQEKSIGLARKLSETEIDRRKFASDMDERLAVAGHTVTDLTHMLAELVENAVRFSPPEASVVIRVRPYPASPGAHVLTVEDCGIGMRPEDLAAANEPLANPREVDLSVSRRLGLHVVARLAERHGISASLSPTPGSGVTAVVVLPPTLFAELSPEPAVPTLVSQHPSPRPQTVPKAQAAPRPGVPPGSPRGTPRPARPRTAGTAATGPTGSCPCMRSPVGGPARPVASCRSRRWSPPPSWPHGTSATRRCRWSGGPS